VGAVRFRLDGRELTTFQMLIDPAMPHPKDVGSIPYFLGHKTGRAC